MRIVMRGEILDALDETAALAAVEAGFRAYSAGKVQLMDVGHLGFSDPPGSITATRAGRFAPAWWT